MSRYTLVLLGLFVAMVAVYGGEEEVRCGAHETWKMCVPICEPSCQDREFNPDWCRGIVCSNSTATCRCDDGYVRDTTDGSCVLLADCQNNDGQQ